MPNVKELSVFRLFRVSANEKSNSVVRREYVIRRRVRNFHYTSSSESEVIDTFERRAMGTTRDELPMIIKLLNSYHSFR